jgi:hypothetical protein
MAPKKNHSDKQSKSQPYFFDFSIQLTAKGKSSKVIFYDFQLPVKADGVSLRLKNNFLKKYQFSFVSERE